MLNDGSIESTASQSIDILDNPFILSLGEVQNTTEGNWLDHIDIGEGKTALNPDARLVRIQHE